MYAIEYFCGRKYQGWHASSSRYETAEAAVEAVDLQIAAERRAYITPIIRRVRGEGVVTGLLT